MTHPERPQRSLLILAFGLVYLFWGSTYLGIRIAVEHLPPALMCGIRFCTSGLLMLVYCAATGRKVFYNAGRLAQMAIVGILLLVGGNLTLSYAEKYVSSGLAALIVASIPLFFLVIDALLLGDHHVSARGMVGLVVGLLGIAVLLWPKLRATSSLERAQLWACLSLLGGSFSWALGSVLAKMWHSREIDALSATGWQMAAAGVGNLFIALGLNDFSRAVWTPRGVGAIAYLVTCGSLIGYTAYIWLLRHAPTSKVSTYAYVNPVVAVFLGWLILREPVDAHILLGSAIVVASVVLVTTSQVKARTVKSEVPSLEPAAN